MACANDAAAGASEILGPQTEIEDYQETRIPRKLKIYGKSENNSKDHYLF